MCHIHQSATETHTQTHKHKSKNLPIETWQIHNISLMGSVRYIIHSATIPICTWSKRKKKNKKMNKKTTEEKKCEKISDFLWHFFFLCDNSTILLKVCGKVKKKGKLILKRMKAVHWPQKNCVRHHKSYWSNNLSEYIVMFEQRKENHLKFQRKARRIINSWLYCH